MNIAKSRKAKILIQIKQCNYYINIIKERILSLEKSGKETKYLEEQLGNYYRLIGEYQKSLKRIDKEIRIKGTVISAIIMLLMFSILFNFNDITGNVVFSKVEGRKDIVNWETSSNINYSWVPDLGRLNTIAISGRYQGDGPLRIFLIADDDPKLLYASESSHSFTSECGSACYLTKEYSSYVISVEMPLDGKLEIEEIEYFQSELSGYSVSPSNLTVNLSTNRFIKGGFDIYNELGNNLSLAIYGEGDLTDYLVLEKSLIRLNDSEHIGYELDLPLAIEPGRYEEVIYVRYLPDGEFKGVAPVEEHRIIVKIMGEKPSASKLSYLLIFLGLIVVVNVVVFFVRRR